MQAQGFAPCAVYKVKRFDMKARYLLVYVFVGAAFLAASAWVFFSHGKNAKAIRAKYRLGGIMLTCMAMLSTASCDWAGGPGSVTCYDPVMVESDNIVNLTLKSDNASYKYNEISRGDTLSVSIAHPAYSQYVLRVMLDNEAGTELQRTSLYVSDAYSRFSVPLSPDVDYKGEAIAQVQAVVSENPEQLSQICYAMMVIKIR